MQRTLVSNLRRLLVLPALAMLVACTSSPPKPEVDYKADYDFGSVRKIAFYDDSGMIGGNNPIPLSDMQRERIDVALEQALGSKGYEMLPEKGRRPGRPADQLDSHYQRQNRRAHLRDTRHGYERRLWPLRRLQPLQHV